jgi:hypothetical protein
MMPAMPPYIVGLSGSARLWRKTTLRQLGKDEKYLEALVAADPTLLGLDPYETGISGNLVTFRQTRLETPTGREVIPDVVLLSESGHVVVVEAKLIDNADLRDRRVVAQVVEYAASVANLDDEALLGWLGEEADETWTSFVRRIFPEAASAERLAATLRRRMQRGEIHLVILCDGAPEGLRDLVRSVAGQAALGDFQLHVVELVPHTAEGIEGILLVPQSVVRTEIVARTAVTINYVAGAERSAVSVVASSVEEVEKAIEEVKEGKTPRPEFSSVIAAYDAGASDELRTFGKSPSYKQVRPSAWPKGIHYEFRDKSGGQANVGIELHLESRNLASLKPGLAALGAKLKQVRPETLYDPKWARGLGRVYLQVPSGDAAGAASAMAAFIEMTAPHIDELLKTMIPST